MTTSTITHAGKNFRFLASVHGDRELVTACRELRAGGWQKLDLTDGSFAGTPVVKEANRVQDESGHMAIVFVAPKT